MEKCERRIEAEKLAAENEVQREAAAAKLNEGHALKVLEIQLVRFEERGHIIICTWQQPTVLTRVSNLVVNFRTTSGKKSCRRKKKRTAKRPLRTWPQP